MFWVSIIVIGNVLFATTSIVFLNRFLTHPTVSTIDRDYTNWNLTFPSITICLDEKVNETELEKFMANRHVRYPELMKILLRSLVNLRFENVGDLFDYEEISPAEYRDVIILFTIF